jgi:hypothetical protein
MSQVIDLRECSNDSVNNGGVCPNTTSVPSSPFLFRKRPWYKQGASNDAHPRNESGPGNKRTATRAGSGSAKFVFDLELAAEVDVDVLPNRKKRRAVVKREPSGKNDGAGKCAQIRKILHATKKDVGTEDAQATDHGEFHEGIAAAVAASHPVECTSRDRGSSKKRYQKVSPSKSPSNALGRQRETSMSAAAVAWRAPQFINLQDLIANNSRLGRKSRIIIDDSDDSSEEEHPIGRESRTVIDDSDDSSEEELPYQAGNCAKKFKEDRLRELVDYRKIHGHCNVRRSNSERNTKLAKWVSTQRTNYRLRLEGKKSSMTLSDVQDLEKLGFEWGSYRAPWESCFSELTNYHKIHGHCNVLAKYSENTKLGIWVGNQRKQYKLHREGMKSCMTPFRIQELESLGFEWDSNGAAWEDRLNELADYRKIHGHCNITKNDSGNTKLGNWVSTQRSQYKFHLEGKKSCMTYSRIQELEGLGFEWRGCLPVWEDRLSELADYRKIHGHCNVPRSHSENTKLGTWVATQRRNYRLHHEGKTSYMTLPHIQELESLGFEWNSQGTGWGTRLSELADYRKIHGHCNVPRNYGQNLKLGRWVSTQRTQHRLHVESKKSHMTTRRIQDLESLGFEWKPCIGLAFDLGSNRKG